MEVQPHMADIIITAAICLHNMLSCNNDTVDREDSAPDPCFTPIRSLRQNYALQATHVKDKYRDYFISAEGSVPWQLEKIRAKT